jgi:hypothetical protein
VLLAVPADEWATVQPKPKPLPASATTYGTKNISRDAIPRNIYVAHIMGM